MPFAPSLQESILTLLVVNKHEGAIASGLLDLSLFEPPYDQIAQAAIDYRRRFDKPPGLAHLDDLFAAQLNPKHKQHQLYKRVILGIAEQASALNAAYVLSRINEFQRTQNLKAAVIDAGTRLQQPGNEQDLVADVEKILHAALKFRCEPLDVGTFLNDKTRALSFLSNPKAIAYGTGIPEFDRRGIGPTPGKAFGFMAPAGRGKTWWCIDAAVKMMMQGASVLHLSLEMGEEELSQRYLQRLFAVSKRSEKFRTTNFELDELERVVGFTFREARAKYSLSDPQIASKLAKRMDEWGVRFGRLLIKQVPESYFSFEQLEAYLDNLELTCKFVPSGFILDYPKLMKLDARQEFRIALGMMQRQLRGLCIKRNFAGAFPIQSNREGEDIKLITGAQTGEDYSLKQTVDFLITYNQTAMEKELGLARLYVDKARSDEDRFTVLITQNYQTGQFVRQSAYLPSSYWDRLEAAKAKVTT